MNICMPCRSKKLTKTGVISDHATEEKKDPHYYIDEQMKRINFSGVKDNDGRFEDHY